MKASQAALAAKNPAVWVRFLCQEDLLEEGMQPTPVFLSAESHGQRSLVGCSPWGLKELDTAEAA